MLLLGLYFSVQAVLLVFTSRMRSVGAAFGLVNYYWEEKKDSVYLRMLMLQFNDSSTMDLNVSFVNV